MTTRNTSAYLIYVSLALSLIVPAIPIRAEELEQGLEEIQPIYLVPEDIESTSAPLEQDISIPTAEKSPQSVGVWLSQTEGQDAVLHSYYGFYALGELLEDRSMNAVRIRVHSQETYPYQLMLYGPCNSLYIGRPDRFSGGCGSDEVLAIATTSPVGLQFLDFVLEEPITLAAGGYYALEIQTSPPGSIDRPITFYGSANDVFPAGYLNGTNVDSSFDGYILVSDGALETPIPEEPGASNVLFLPGIKGSRLYGDGGEKLWEPFGDHDVEALMLDPSGKSLRSDIHTKSGEVVDMVAGVTDIYGSFIEFMDRLEEDDVIRDWEAVPYDWRLSLPDIVNGGTEEGGQISYIGTSDHPYIRERLEELAQTSKSGKVTIVAHSNGGLVAKQLLLTLGEEETQRLVDKVILIGVPQSGAPQALGALLYGYKEGLPWWFPGIVSTAAARSFAENSPMGYHLLPSTNYFSSTDHPVVRFTDTEGYTNERAAYGETIESFAELRSFALAEDGGREKPHAGNFWEANVVNESLLNYAEMAHEEIDGWTPPAEVEVYQIAGWGEDTVAGIEYYERCVLSICKKMYRPTFTSEGDGVVPLQSALVLSDVESYWIDLQAYGFGPIGKKDHGNLLTIDDTQSLISNLLVEEHSLPENIYSEEISGVNIKKKLYFYLHSPLTLELHDMEGNRVGPDQDGTVDENISGAEYGVFGDVQYIIAPADNEYELKLEGYGSGTFTLEVQEVEGNDAISETAFVEIPVSTDTAATMSIDSDSQVEYVLKVDIDGDDEIDARLYANPGEAVTYDASTARPPEEESSRRAYQKKLPVPEETLEQLQLKLYRLLLQILLEYLQNRP